MNAEIQTRAILRLEQRVPEGYSATREEHRWHTVDYVAPVDAKELNASQAFEHAAVLFDAARPRNDYEYRVVLISTEVTKRVVQS